MVTNENEKNEYVIVAAMYKLPILDNIIAKAPVFNFLKPIVKQIDNYVHNFWCLRNIETNQIVAQLHGLAASAANLKDKKPVGGLGDKLQAFHCIYDQEFAKKYNAGVTDEFSLPLTADYAYTAYRGEESVSHWLKAVAAIEKINALGLNYPPGGFVGNTKNSNTIYRTFAEIMSIPLHHFEGYKEVGIEHTLYPELEPDLTDKVATTINEEGPKPNRLSL